MSEEIVRIQRMVAEGKVTPEEGAELMASVEKEQPAIPLPASAPGIRPGWILWPLVSHAIIGVVPVAILLFVVPRFAKVFKSLGAELPPITGMILRLSWLTQHYFFLLAPMAILLLATDVAIYVLLRRYTPRVLPALWWWIVTLALAAAVIVIVLGLYLPNIQMMEQIGNKAGGA